MKNGRELFGATSASQSTISGAGVQSFTAFTTNQVKVTAKDSSGVSRGIGNDVFWIRIENQCTKGTSFEWIDVSSQRKVLQTEISQKMYDNLDGTYTYSYSSNLDGTITVYVFLYTNGGIYAEYFDSSKWSGTPATKTTMSTLNSGWTSGTLITASRSSYVTIAYYARIKAPTSDTYTIYIEVDDTAKVFIDSTLIISNGYGNYSTTGKNSNY